MPKSLEERGPFGKFLFLQIKNHHRQTAQWLADELTKLDAPLDASLIRHWMSGNKVPPEDYESLSQMAKILGCSVSEISEVHKDARKWLKKKKKKAQQARNQRRKNIKNNDGLLEVSNKRVQTQSKGNIKNYAKRLKSGEKSIGIEGARNCLETVICFLEELERPEKGKNKDRLYLMVNGRTATIEEFADDLMPRWYEAMKSVLSKGWTVNHVIRIDDDLERIKKMVHGILHLVGHSGKYIPLAFKQKYVLPVAESFLLVPSLHKGMILYSSSDRQYVGSAIYIEDEVQIRILTDHFKLLRDEMNRIFRIENKYSDVFPRLLQADKVPGNRIVILKRLSDIQRPERLYSESSDWAQAHAAAHYYGPDELHKCLKARRERQIALEKHSQSHQCRYIYTNRCVSEFLESGTEVALPNYAASVDERLEQLSVFEKFLQYPDYEMAMSEEIMYRTSLPSKDVIAKVGFPDIIPDFCEVQENCLALMQIPIKRGVGQQSESKWIVITEPIIVKAFYQYLIDIWEKRIDIGRKSKFNISLWIATEKQRLESIKDEASAVDMKKVET